MLEKLREKLKELLGKNTKVPKSRNYAKEYSEFHKKPEQKKRRALRNKARRKAMKSGRVRKGDGKDVHHTTGNPASSKTRVTTAHFNRGKGRVRVQNGRKK